MAADIGGNKKACVIGGTGFVASLLIKLLLEKGYAVNTTVRDPANLTDESGFDAPIAGCIFVFHVATPVNFAFEDLEVFVLTSSTAAVSINNLQGTGLVMDEENWMDVEFLTSVKPLDWGYPASKTLTEKAAWRFAEENDVELITVIPTLLASRSLTQDVPSSVCLAMSLLTGNEFLMNGLKDMQMLSGSIFITHVEDVCRAHIRPDCIRTRQTSIQFSSSMTKPVP
ncbi:hypothetical protein NL676_012984 [Syzygium grande]|nr:hypothetical protein NL676_012984 [Syzygium grande]